MKGWIGRLVARRDAARLRHAARASGDPFRESPYYEAAEPDMDEQWRDLIWPMIRDCDFTATVDLAAGHGRNSAKLLEHVESLTIVDINEECLDACRRRFAGDRRVSFVRTDGTSLRGIADRSVTFVYSFDAMVHFEPEVVAAYLDETARVLTDEGRAFFHHSNRPLPPDTTFHDAPHWRNHMTRELFDELAARAGLGVVGAREIDWGSGPDRHETLDGLTLLARG